MYSKSISERFTWSSRTVSWNSSFQKYTAPLQTGPRLNQINFFKLSLYLFALRLATPKNILDDTGHLSILSKIMIFPLRKSEIKLKYSVYNVSVAKMCNSFLTNLLIIIIVILWKVTSDLKYFIVVNIIIDIFVCY